MNTTKFALYIFITIFFLLNLNLILGITTTKNNLENYFRLHVVANSDSISDQMLKLKVTDKVNEYIKTLTENITNKNEYIEKIQNNIQNILIVANSVLEENHSSYEALAYLGNIKYDEKSYNNLTMKAGTYKSLKIVIGNGNGENWWSLLYPSMPQNLSIQDTLNNEDINIKSKILELFQELVNVFN